MGIIECDFLFNQKTQSKTLFSNINNRHIKIQANKITLQRTKHKKSFGSHSTSILLSRIVAYMKKLKKKREMDKTD